MKNSRRQVLGALAGLASPVLAQAQASAFPEADRLLRIVVPFAAGGGVDSAARLLANQLGKQLGLSVIVENRAGASGTLGGKFVQTAPSDGYTLLFSAATHVHARQVLKNPPYDPQTDFAPVARVGEAPLMLVIAPDLEPRKLSEVLSAARSKSDSWTAGIPAAGAPSHLATLLLARMGQVNFSYIAYKGTQPALVDVAGGHVNLLLDSMISLLPLAKSGKVRPIAITSRKRSALAPEVPTVAESGLPQYTYSSWYGVWAPRGTPNDRVQALNKAINASVAEIGRSGGFSAMGIETVSETPEEFRRFVTSEVSQGMELLKAAGFKPE
ncbi:tripartite tricarboxylate transporter substrate-binding protein [Curvibacter sp. RS43]|uniref:Tripartite tricarboxylate transporter substrate-binding protein n=1 Tax=Curvibacter microcysteis TaxID=3026419 RepID=A0ABT5M9P2_9BURK|nr:MULTISPECIES: tripartite tricarboxylate transporter substrate-binding protein [unclassified Curvibacter]MDD0812834.1 tripartite tricarboxylate transporter substrate-binding protein [Curvibacter sp. RS43]MDD0813305.1 tripartite tricarboxylate transporter substrate-binding protein [Curvibacter sp. HBC28]